jgi:hypothetical protein
MIMGDPELDERVRQYAELHRREFKLKQPLGEGTDGRVWFTTSNSAIKVFHRLNNYRTELGCYQRLMEKGVAKIDGLSVPQLIEYSHELAIIEITLVQPPYLLDFGKAYLDEPAPYSPEQLEEWRDDWARYFPVEDLPRVRKVLAILKGYGIDYVDPKPWNIRFRKEEDDEEDEV